MLSEFRIYHKKGGDHQGLDLPDEYWHFGTCMRSIVFTNHKSFNSGLNNYESFKGEDAYKFLLEVICGLHSKLLGETEILGQFREFSRLNKNVLPRNLNEIVNFLLKDAKFIRTEFLQNLGCQSYGSLLRKNLKKEDKKIVFIGAGLLVKDILPWLGKSKLDLKIYTQNPEKHQDLKKLASFVEVQGYSKLSSEKNAVLVIAAPVSKDWILSNVRLNNFSRVYDLRGQSEKEVMDCEHYLSLTDFIGDLEKNQVEARAMKNYALKSIEERTFEKKLIEKSRPFGWEDLWAYS